MATLTMARMIMVISDCVVRLELLGFEAIFRASHFCDALLIDRSISRLAFLLVENTVQSFHRAATNGLACAMNAMEAGFDVPDDRLGRVMHFIRCHLGNSGGSGSTKY